MCVPEPREDPAGRDQAEGLDQFPPQQPQRHGVEEHRPLARKADDAAFGVELEHFTKVEIRCAHPESLARFDVYCYQNERIKLGFMPSRQL